MSELLYGDIDEYLRPAKASNYISSIDSLRPGDPVFIVARVSTLPQWYARHHVHQDANVRAAVLARGGVVAGTYALVRRGHNLYWLAPTAADARGVGAVALVAESVDRFIRSDGFSPQTPHVLPRHDEYEWLRYLTEGFPLMTVVPPDAPPTEARGHQSRRGQEASGNSGGRPPATVPGALAERRRILRPRALELKEGNASIRQIAAELDVPASTIQGWLE